MLVAAIPKNLVYEEHLGQPIYYKGYQKFLNHPENFSKNDITGTSSLQTVIISRILFFLAKNIDIKLYECLTNEVGIHFEKGENRACDIAIFRRENLKNYPINENYFTIAPKVVIEVDIKADLENNSTFNYW